MSNERDASGCRRADNVWVLIGLLLSMAWGATSARAQEGTVRPVIPPEVSMADLRRAPGQLVAEGSNGVPTGPLKVKTYRLEEVRLPQPIEVGNGESRASVESAFRLTITGESFLNGNHTVWIDDEPVGSGLSGMTELVMMIYGQTPAEDGVSISVSLDSDPDSRTTLPERLQLPAHLRREGPSADTDGNTVRLRRIASSPALFGQPAIEVELTSKAIYPIGNAELVLQIGNQEFLCGERFNGDSHTLVSHLSEEDFARLRDRDIIRVKYGRGLTRPSYQRFGRLNKRLLGK